MEQEAKKCPYCGEEILAVAKKCKHCGEWLGQDTPRGTGSQNESLLQVVKRVRETTGVSLAEAKKAVDECHGNYDKAIDHLLTHSDHTIDVKNQVTAVVPESQKDEPEGELGWLFILESMIIFGVITYAYDLSFWKSAGVWVLMLFLMAFRIVRIIFSLLFSALWGFIATLLCPWIFDESELKMASRLVNNDYADYWYVGFGVFLVALLFHWDTMKKMW